MQSVEERRQVADPADLIIAARERQARTNAWLSRQTGIPEKTLARWLNAKRGKRGKRYPHFDDIVRLFWALGLELGQYDPGYRSTPTQSRETLPPDKLLDEIIEAAGFVKIKLKRFFEGDGR